jgi:hypothetical protein
VLVVLLIGASAAAAWAQDGIDIDLWHAELAEAMGPEPEHEQVPPSLGLYPELGVALGPPNWYSAQGNVFISCSNGRSFSIFGGYGVERGPNADAQIFTLGWGGVRRIPVASRQHGFHGKFLRYRRWDEEDHGEHHGVSIGTMHGVGIGALSFEVGAARSSRNHWLINAQISLKFALPVYIPLKKGDLPPPDQADSPPDSDGLESNETQKQERADGNSEFRIPNSEF